MVLLWRKGMWELIITCQSRAISQLKGREAKWSNPKSCAENCRNCKKCIKVCISYECIPRCLKFLNFQQPLKHIVRVFLCLGGQIQHLWVRPLCFWALQFSSTKITSLESWIHWIHQKTFDLWSHFYPCSWEIGSVPAERVGQGEVGRFARRMMAVSGLSCRKALVGTI